jgi:4-amino-4-deoxy-L-arabinose transferase-like glycosyltransferase
MPENVATDASDYAHLAEALLHGSVIVDYDGGPPRFSRYTPGFSVLLMPAVAIGGLESAVWVCFAATLALGLLAARLGWLVGGPLAGLMATLLVLFNVGTYIMARIIMSDVVSAVFSMAELALVAEGVGAPSATAAGLLGGALVWIRPGAAVLALAAPSALKPVRQWQRTAWYLLGLVVPVGLLALWQWQMFGSPLVTSYQATNAGSGPSSDIGAFFSWTYVVGPAWNSSAAGTEPNGAFYPLALIGANDPYTFPGLGVIGLLGAISLARRPGANGIVGRYTLATVVLTLLLYVPYFYQDVRFMVVPIELLHVTAAVILVRGITWLAARLRQMRLRPAA